MTLPESFADYPTTIGDLRSEREGCKGWSPREALIDLLRDIDAGRIKPTALVVGAVCDDGNGETSFTMRQAAPNVYVSLGLAQRLIFRLQERD